MRSFAGDPGPAPLAAKAAAIDVMFGHDTVEQCLEAARSSGDDWAAGVAREMAAKSPTSLKVTLAALRHARTLGSLEDCLNMEFRIISRMFHAPDFREGVRAALIDKDQSPRWQPASLSEVSEAAVSAHFAPLGPKELGSFQRRPAYKINRGNDHERCWIYRAWQHGRADGGQPVEGRP